jgi:hypothetical protein
MIADDLSYCNDDEFFDRQANKVWRQEMGWLKNGRAQIILSDEQMRAVGKVVVRAMTRGAQGEPYLSDEQTKKVTLDISQHLSAILRQEIATFWTHFYTISRLTGNCRENLIFSFLPHLVFNQQTVLLRFDRLADRETINEEELVDFADGEYYEHGEGGGMNASPPQV